MLKHLFTITMVLLCHTLSAQQHKEKRSGVFYFSFGSHRAFYTPGDIRFVSNAKPSFDFTLENVKGRDDGGIRWKTSPQYSYNIGYYSRTGNFGIEYQFDHVKYTMVQGQVARMKGIIGENHYDTDTVLHRDFVKLEHTDGANYAMLNFVKWKNLATGKKQHRSLDLVLKAGGGIVVPKTNSIIMGKHNDDRYAISGFVLGVEPGIRYNFLKNFFAFAGFKGAYANYSHFRIADGYGSQQWFSMQFNLMLGVQVGR